MEMKRGDGRHCELCGSSSPKVRCEKCLNQIFCLSCDDMYHRHPKRMNHTRKVWDVKLIAFIKKQNNVVCVLLTNYFEHYLGSG